MKNVFIIHGSFGHPEENWIPWLKSELENNGYEVTVPKFPTPEGQSLDGWMEVMRPHLGEINEETILIGHSIGPSFIFSILERIEKPVAKAVLVSGFLGLLGNEDFDTINQTISDREFDWDKINNNAQEFAVFHGSNDPYVPTEKALEIGHHLGTKPILIENGGHLNEAAGYTEFPKLLDKILE